MKVIKNILIGYIVCNKYNIKFRPWRKVKYSPASFEINSKGQFIWCSVLDKMFIPSLFHELAHCMDYKLTKFRRKVDVSLDYKVITDLHMTRQQYSHVLATEARANKYAVRLLKSTNLWTEDYQLDLEWAMTTYINYVDKKDIADYHYSTMKYIRG